MLTLLGVVLLLLIQTPLLLIQTGVELEEGATFQDGICWEADGTEGMAAPDGSCVTPADYDELYSVENLVEHGVIDEHGKHPATGYQLVEIGVPASQRLLGEGVVAILFTFNEFVYRAHNDPTIVML